MFWHWSATMAEHMQGELLRLNIGENVWRWVWLGVAILVLIGAIVFARNRTPHKHPTPGTLFANDHSAKESASKVDVF